MINISGFTYGNYFTAALTCVTLMSPTNGHVSYSTGTPYLYGTMATYNCSVGFGLNGGTVVRTCEGDGSSYVGMWTGGEPVCDGELI